MFQMGSVGLMPGQAHYFLAYAPEKIPYAMQRYLPEAKSGSYGRDGAAPGAEQLIARNEYTIADIAIMPWLRSYERQGVNMDEYPHVRKWFDGIGARPAVKRGLAVRPRCASPVMEYYEKRCCLAPRNIRKGRFHRRYLS